MTKRLLTLLLLISLPCAIFSQAIVQTYRNPVIAGDHPDPSIIRVNDDYYAVSTSGDMAPCYPLYHSRDLINWQRIGAIFDTPPSWVGGACWAPELFYDKGIYYVFYTAKRKSDGVSCIGMASTTDITKPFKDYGIIIEWGTEAIDAFVLRDQSGKLYITWKAYGLDKRPIEVLCSELSEDCTTLLGEHFTLTAHDKGWRGNGDEGQSIVFHDGYYYFFYSVGSCCEPRCDYRVEVARSKSLRGPWEQHKGNPILAGGEMWKCTGHGTLVETKDKRWFYLYHAFQTYDFELIGRQSLLDEMMWDKKTGWPYFKYGPNPTSQAPVPFPGTVQQRQTQFYDDFTGEPDNQWRWDMQLPRPEVKRGNGSLTLRATNKGICVYGIDAVTGNYVAETHVEGKSEGFHGLSVYGSSRNYVAWGIENGVLKLFKVRAGQRTDLFSAPGNATYLRVEAQNARLLRFYWSTDKTNWNMVQIDALDGSFLARAGGVRLALMANNYEKEPAAFSYFSLISKY